MNAPGAGIACASLGHEDLLLAGARHTDDLVDTSRDGQMRFSLAAKNENTLQLFGFNGLENTVSLGTACQVNEHEHSFGTGVLKSELEMPRNKTTDLVLSGLKGLG